MHLPLRLGRYVGRYVSKRTILCNRPLVYMTFSDGLMVTDPNNLALVHLQNNDFVFAFRHLGCIQF